MSYTPRPRHTQKNDSLIFKTEETYMGFVDFVKQMNIKLSNRISFDVETMRSLYNAKPFVLQN